MRQVKIVLLGTFFLIMGSGLCSTLSGCGDDSKVSETTVTPEAKKADEGLQNAMKDMMQSKKGKAAPKK